MYLFYHVTHQYLLPTLYSCLVRKLLQKHLNISFRHSKMDPFCGPIVAQILKYSPNCTVWLI